MEDLPVPLSRVESYLAKACGMDVITPEPGPGIEPFLYAIAYNTTPPVAGYRTEEWLAYVQGVTPAKPLELEGSCIIGNQKVDVKYFAVAAGMPGATLPEKPQNRKEKYWEYIATHRPAPGVLKYATGTNITLTDVVRGIEELQFVYGDTFQQTYSGENLYNVEDTQQTSAEVSVDSDGWITMQYDNSAGSSVKYLLYYSKPLQLEADTDYAIVTEIKSIKSSADNLTVYDSAAQTQFNNSQTYNYSGSGAVSPGTNVSIGHTKADMSSATIGLRTFLKISAGVNQTVTFRISVLANTSVTPETFVYQPYTGGIPSPNPDYPQPIQVVTGEQTISIHGKNLFDTYSTTVYAPTATYGDVSNNNGVITTNVNGRARIGNGFIVPVPVEPGETYCISAKLVETTSTYNIKGSVDVRAVVSDGRGARVRLLNFDSLGTLSSGFVIPDGVTEIWVSFMSYEADNYSVFSDVQIEKGSSATSFEPGTPHSYTVDLGATELCKISDYQDYIYKSGDDWYVHKEIQKILVDGVNIKVSSQHTAVSGINGFRIGISSVGNLGYNGALSDNFGYVPWGTYNSSNRTYGVIASNFASTLTTIYVTQPNNTTGTTLDSAGITSMNTWFSNHNTLIYYVLATPTDTKITDATLVGQLEAIDLAVLPKPIAYITVGATDPNLPGPLKISYYGEEE